MSEQSLMEKLADKLFSKLKKSYGRVLLYTDEDLYLESEWAEDKVTEDFINKTTVAMIKFARENQLLVSCKRVSDGGNDFKLYRRDGNYVIETSFYYETQYNGLISIFYKGKTRCRISIVVFKCMGINIYNSENYELILDEGD